MLDEFERIKKCSLITVNEEMWIEIRFGRKPGLGYLQS